MATGKLKQKCVNNTAKYVASTYKKFNKDLVSLINTMANQRVKALKLWTIGDMSYSVVKNKDLTQHLFIVLDFSVYKKAYPKNIDKINEYIYRIRDFNEYYDDYPYGNFNESDSHVFVFKISDEFKDVIPKFIEGKYSEMYTKDQIDELFDSNVGEHENRIYQVLLKDPKCFVDFEEILKNEFNLDKDFKLKIEKDIELELPIKEDNEFINSKIK